VEMAVTEPSGIQYRKQISKLTLVINIRSTGLYVSVNIHSGHYGRRVEIPHLLCQVLFRWPTIFSSSFCHLYFDESMLHSEGVQSHLKYLKI